MSSLPGGKGQCCCVLPVGAETEGVTKEVCVRVCVWTARAAQADCLAKRRIPFLAFPLMCSCLVDSAESAATRQLSSKTTLVEHSKTAQALKAGKVTLRGR